MTATWTGTPATQRVLPLLFPSGDGSDGAYSSSGSQSYSGVSGVAATGDVYIGQFTTFALNDGHTLTLDQSFNILQATGAVTLGGGSSGIIDGDDNGPVGGSNPGNQGPAPAGDGPGSGLGAEGNDSNDGGGGGGGRADGTIGVNNPNSNGKQIPWMDYFVTGDLDTVGAGGGGGAGATQINVAKGGNGGDAGGGLYVISKISITLAAGFTFTSDAANGAAATGGAGKGGGGGGAGGALILMAPKITIAATSGTVVSATGGTGAAGSSTGTGGNGSDGNVVLLYQDWYSVGGDLMSSTNLAARCDPDALTYQFRPYTGRSGRIL